MRPGGSINIQTTEGAPVTSGDTVVTPQAQAVTIQLQLPYFGAGFVWNRPAAVLVEKDGQQERVPIVNVTRLAMLAAGAMGLVLAFVVYGLASNPANRKEGKHG